jgi:hypothetical protein
MAEVRLATDRLVLSAWREADHAPLLALGADPCAMALLEPLLTARVVDAAVTRQCGFQPAHGDRFRANLDAASARAVTVPANRRGRGLMERRGMTRPAGLDCEHPAIAPESPLRHRFTYSCRRPQ